MNRFLTLVLVVCCSIPTFAGEGRIRRSGNPAPGVYIAVLHEDAAGRSEIAAEMSRRFGSRTRRVFAGFPGFVFEGPEQTALAIAHDPRVAWVEEDTIGYVQQTPNTTPRPFPPGWALDRTDQNLPPLDNLGTPGCQTATGIRIYVTDSGINDPDGAEFGTRLRDLFKASNSWSYRDNLGHGTAVASMAGGSRHGLARGAEIVNVKVNSTAAGRVDDLIAGITRIDVDHYKRNLNNPSPKPAVVNVSLYFAVPDFTEGLLSALDLAVLNSLRGCTAIGIDPDLGEEECTAYNSAPKPYGLTYVVGAGNYNTDNITGSPARLANDPVRPWGTITVGATMMANEWTSDWRAKAPDFIGSNYGDKVDIWAPGYQNDVARHQVVNGSVTQKLSGTSLASPFVAGQVARLAYSNPAYTSTQLETLLKNNGTSKLADGVNPVIRDIPKGILLRYAPGRCRW